MLIKVAKFVINVVPEAMANSIVRSLAAMTQRPPVSSFEQEAMAQASKMSYGGNNVAWVWGDGPLVIFVHGWSGRAAQLAPLALHVANAGFRSVAIDVTGHGDSPKRHTRWDYFLRDIAALSQSHHEEVYAYVGHSAGALCMMAARALKGIHAQCYACICAPSFPFPPINVIQKKLNPKEGVLEYYKKYIAEQFETTWEELQAGSSYADAGSDTLLFYDETDRFVDHSEGDKIQGLCPGARLVKTSAYSHQKILAAPELAQAVGEFLKKRLSLEHQYLERINSGTDVK
jgi:pimeloyl-ACP methyl ester carboxylesterase